MHKICLELGRTAHWVKYENINNSDLDGMSLASFYQSRAELWSDLIRDRLPWQSLLGLCAMHHCLISSLHHDV